MWDLSVCVACLATDVRMYSMSASSLLQPYQLLAGVQMNDGMPQKLCWECASLVNKFNLFRHKCERAYLLLQDIYNQHDEITESQIKEVPREHHHLSSSYSTSEIYVYHIRGANDFKTKTKDSAKKVKTSETEVKFENVMISEKLDGSPLKLEVEVLKPEMQILETIKVEEDEQENFVDLGEGVFDFDNDDANVADAADVEVRKKRKSGGKEKVKVVKDGHKRKNASVCRTTTQDFKAKEIVLTQEEARNIYLQRQKSSKYRKAKFKCMLCYRVYKDCRAYEKHRLKHDPVKGEYECDTCRMRFHSRAAIRIHIGVQHSKKYICTLCSKVSYTREIAKLHYKVHQKGGRMRKRRKKTKKLVKVTSAEEFNTVQVILTQEQMMEVVRERQYAEGYSAARYKCTLCYKPFNEDRPFSNHMRQHDPISGTFVCDICNIRYKTRRKLYKHISCNHMKRYSCKSCPHVCYNRASAQKHFAWHKGVVYTCHICGATSVRMSTHLSHLRIKHPSQHICGECGDSFVSKKGLYHHRNKMHSVKRETAASEVIGPYCADCDIQFSSTQVWTKHILISPKHELERHTIVNGCQYCGETFPTAAELKRHHVTDHKRYRKAFQKTSQKQFPAKCTQCEETMTSAGKYWQHFRQQHPGKPFPLTRSSFICEYCGNWFKHKSALDVHAQTHSDKRTHQCAVCPKRFVKLLSLAAHAESHADSGQYSCDVCSRQFAYKHALTNHFRTHTVEKPHVCEWCGKTFAYDCNLKKHELTVHCAAPAAPSSSHPV